MDKMLNNSFKLDRHGEMIIKEENIQKMEQLKCTRTEPYDNPEIFQTALNIVKDKFSEGYFPKGKSFSEVIGHYYNCINFELSEFDNSIHSDVLFFDNKNSTHDNLIIKINNKYDITDPYLTSMLLANEISHLINFITINLGFKDNYNFVTDCYNTIIGAYSNEYYIYKLFDTDQRNNIKLTLNTLSQSPESEENILKRHANDILIIIGDIDELVTACEQQQEGIFGESKKVEECFTKEYLRYLDAYVREDPQNVLRCNALR